MKYVKMCLCSRADVTIFRVAKGGNRENDQRGDAGVFPFGNPFLLAITKYVAVGAITNRPHLIR